MSIFAGLEYMIEIIESAKLDALRFDRENLTAGVRVRKKIQEARKEGRKIRATIQEKRREIIEKRKATKHQKDE